jgi:HEPN domain-containing protein
LGEKYGCASAAFLRLVMMEKNELITYWLVSAEDNHKSMRNMFANGEYVWSLFVGHLCIEKLLKAIYVRDVEPIAPRIHDLYKLSVRCNLELTEDQKDILQYITLFNIEARYEEYKRDFYKKCTKEFALQSINKIEEMRTWLLEKIHN